MLARWTVRERTRRTAPGIEVYQLEFVRGLLRADRVAHPAHRLIDRLGAITCSRRGAVVRLGYVLVTIIAMCSHHR